MVIRYFQFYDNPGDPAAAPSKSDIFARWNNGMLLAVMPAEWDARDTDVPVLRENANQLLRYQSYDNAARDPDLDVED